MTPHFFAMHLPTGFAMQKVDIVLPTEPIFHDDIFHGAQ